MENNKKLPEELRKSEIVIEESAAETLISYMEELLLKNESINSTAM